MLRSKLSITTVAMTTVIALATLAMSGCGFHLKGQVPLSASLSPLALDGNDRGLLSEIREAVDFNGMPMTTDEDSAGAVLRLIDADYERRVRTTDDRGRATSYTLVYQVRVEVQDVAGESLVDPFSVTTRRDLAFDRTRVLQAEERERDLREDMQREISQTILRRLSKIASLKPSANIALGSLVPSSIIAVDSGV